MKSSLTENIQKVAMFIDNYAYDIGKLIAFGISILFLIDFIRTDNSPVIFLVLLVMCVYFPIFCGVMAVVMFFVKLISNSCLLFFRYYTKNNTDNNTYQYDRQYNYDEYHKKSSDTYGSSKESSYNNKDYSGTHQERDSYNNRQSNNSSNNSSARTRSELDIALAFYGLKIPYTEKMLKEKRKELIKKAHPDSGGSEDEAKKINTYYDILKKYIS